jgi:hypothetical protein
LIIYIYNVKIVCRITFCFINSFIFTLRYFYDYWKNWSIPSVSFLMIAEWLEKTFRKRVNTTLLLRRLPWKRHHFFCCMESQIYEAVQSLSKTLLRYMNFFQNSCWMDQFFFKRITKINHFQFKKLPVLNSSYQRM